MSSNEPRVALLAGASGFVGGYVLDSLLDAPDFSRVFAVSRRPLGREHPRLANRIVQFEKLESQLKGGQCHIAFCCLGTTMKQAGSEKAFREVDHDLVLSFARVAKAAQAQRFVVVTSAAADPRSKNFYLRVKGEVEQALERMMFPSLDILQPGPMLGWRGDIRPLELLATAFMPLVNPFLTGSRIGLRGISARTVAAAAVGAARSGRRGVYRYTWPSLRQLADLKPVRR
ncbi:MAG: NAD-dependent epimerase/dehydratase family protein [Gammaproteobacteria bacterium]